MDLTPTPKIAPKSPKAKKGPEFGRIKNTKIELYFKNHSLLSTLVGSENVFEPDHNPKRPKQAGAELGQAQHNWKLGLAEAEVGAELGNKSSSLLI